MKAKNIFIKNPLFFAFFFPAFLDGIVTLLGQSSQYWGGSRTVNEASPAYYFLLVSPWLFLLGSIVWFVFWYWLFKRLKEPLNLFFMLLFIAGHSWGSSSWIMKMLREAGVYTSSNQLSVIFAWFLLVFYFLLIAIIATYCLITYIRRGKKGAMTKSEGLVYKAKQLIDNGFDKIGRSITNPSMLDRYFVAATYKAVRLSDAILVLCDRGMTDEALSTLRSLIEHSINMRWIANKDSKKRLKQYTSDFAKGSFGTSWTNTNLHDRMKEVGFKDRDYFDFCVKLTYSYAHVNASSLKWGEVINHPQLSKDRWSPDALYVVVAQMLGHVLKALDTHFVGKFKGCDEIWNQVSVDKDIRRKVEQIRKSFEEVD